MIYNVKSLIDNTCTRLNDNELVKYYNKKYQNNNIHLKLLDNNQKGFCFNFALPNFKIYDCQDGLWHLKSNYNQIFIEELSVGDIVTFFSKDMSPNITDDNIHHFGIVKTTDQTIEGTIILSKWGIEGVFESNLNSVPCFYGKRVCFWRKK